MVFEDAKEGNRQRGKTMIYEIVLGKRTAMFLKSFDIQNKQRPLELGAIDFCVKPFDMDALLTKID